MKYRELKTGELLRIGDEYCIGRDDWWPTQSAGLPLPKNGYLTYRRPIKENHPNTKLFK